LESAPNNPPTNELRAGLDESAVTAAIQKSGYPLQTVVGNKLRPTFKVHEEWSFIDSDTSTLRTLDILAERQLFDPPPLNQPRVRPILDLLIECKKSELPYIFFISDTKPWIGSFPLFAGLFKRSLDIATTRKGINWILPITTALGFDNDPFISSGVPCSMTFSKCTRTGGKVELSGEDSFRNLVLPLMKALHHFEKSEAPAKTHQYHDCHLALAVAVIDAPMIATNVANDGTTSLVLTPWIRVVRHEAKDNDDYFKRYESYAIDVVHKDFFESFVSDHALPFAERFSEVAIKHHVELATGQAFLEGEPTSSIKIETRLKPAKD
jgi:hypothetical protein